MGLLATTAFAACHKAGGDNASATDFNTLKTTVLTDFTNDVAVSSYLKLSVAAANLNTALGDLDSSPTDHNLDAARTSWKNMREIWEQCEGFLFGPVEDNDYDPNMDTWPTDYRQMDSLLASNNALEVTDIQNLTLSLRGFHAIEYVIFGDHGSRRADGLTGREKKYMLSLSTDLTNTCNALYLSWTSAPVNFAETVMNAGNAGSRYAGKQEAYLALAGAMVDICDEVGSGKMKEPYDARDPELVESPYSGNSVTDFKNNIIGVQNVYLGLNGGASLSDLVAAKNKSLDNTLKTQIAAAVGSFDKITENYEDAILDQRVQVQQTMTAVQDLQASLENGLLPFIQQYVTD